MNKKTVVVADFTYFKNFIKPLKLCVSGTGLSFNSTVQNMNIFWFWKFCINVVIIYASPITKSV